MLYYNGMLAWQLPAFIATLPLLLHLALFLFLAGLVVLLWGLDRTIALMLFISTSALGGFYSIAFLLPVWYTSCPSAVPLLDQLSRSRYALRRDIRHIIMRLTSRDFMDSDSMVYLVRSGGAAMTSALKSAISHAQRHMHISRYWHRLKHEILPSPEMLKSMILEQNAPELDAAAIQWTVRECSMPDPIIVACQAAGTLHPASRTAHILRDHGDTLDTMARLMQMEYNRPPHSPDEAQQSAAGVARCLRAYAVLCPEGEDVVLGHVSPWMRGISSYELPILSACLPERMGDDYPGDSALLPSRSGRWEQQSHPSLSLGHVQHLTSTGLQMLRWRAVPLTSRLAIISRLDLTLLMDADFAHLVRTTLPHAICYTHEDHDKCSSACALDMFCAFMLRPSSHGLSHTDEPIVVTILRSLVTTYSYPNSPIPRGHFPNIWEFAASGHIFSASWTGNELAGFSEFLYGILDSHPSAPSQAQCRLIMSALRCILEAAFDLQDASAGQNESSFAAARIGPTLDAVTVAFCISATDIHPRAPWIEADQPCPDTETTLAALVSSGPITLLSTEHRSRSLWTRLCARSWRHHVLYAMTTLPGMLSREHSSGMELIVTISAHLCQYRRHGTPWVNELVKEFFAFDWSLEVLRMTLHVPRPDTKQKLEAIIQHCAELRPGWWTSLRLTVEQLADDTDNVTLKERVREFDKLLIAKRLRQCSKCTPRRDQSLVL
ncbi:hypothetical protein EXIGLDRAFT_127800 [Exidia glandulosa HHB12029]|uniref:DUF6535 domain-containing protein n=1 Tax=Exidia glandulosa HHB12029 TaxID=1314781 RepID=A0A165G998_EXIGL|nr:hypothetical protein EXIGLDRAFT_127800 [Exidia glandulosa HHB12029]